MFPDENSGENISRQEHLPSGLGPGEKHVQGLPVSFPMACKFMIGVRVREQDPFQQKFESYLLPDITALSERITFHKIESLGMAFCHKAGGEANKSVPGLRSQSVF